MVIIPEAARDTFCVPEAGTVVVEERLMVIVIYPSPLCAFGCAVSDTGVSILAVRGYTTTFAPAKTVDSRSPPRTLTVTTPRVIHSHRLERRRRGVIYASSLSWVGALLRWFAGTGILRIERSLRGAISCIYLLYTREARVNKEGSD